MSYNEYNSGHTMDYDKLKYIIENYKDGCVDKNMDVDDLFIAGVVTKQFVKFTGEDLSTINDTLVRDHIWMGIEASYKKVLDHIKNYDEYYCSEFCDDDDEKEENNPYDYNILLEAIKEAKKKNPIIYVTRWGIFRTEIIEQYWKLYNKPKEIKHKKKATNTIFI